MELALALVDANTHLHVSLDVDFFDPDIAPGVGTTVRGGPTYREAQLCMEMIADTGRWPRWTWWNSTPRWMCATRPPNWPWT
jgi:arginase family enzyme